MNLVSAWIAAAIAVFAITAPTALAVAPTALDPVAPGVPGDGSAWELVTPGEVVPARPVIFGRMTEEALPGISQSGDRVVYRSAGTLPDAPFGGVTVSNLAVRGAEGWTSRSLVAPAPASATVFGIDGPKAFDPDLRSSLWTNFLPGSDGTEIYASGLDGTYTELFKVGYGGLVGASTDLARFVFTSERHLLPADASRTRGASLYQLEGSTLRLIDLEDDGSLVSACGGVFPSFVSLDAQRVLFWAQPDCVSAQHTYLWAGGHAIDISASRCTLPDCGPEAWATPVGMTPSGSDAFIESLQRLTDEDPDNMADLYRYELASGTLSLITPHDPCCPANILGPVRAADGSRAYFSATGPLRAEDPPVPSLYLFEDGELRYIAPSGGYDFRISPDGRYVFLTTTARLAASDNDDASDLYRYDAVSGEAVQISIGTEGRGNGPFDAALSFRNEGTVGPGAIVFETAEQLLPGDRNESTDLYLWREGAGIALISAGVPGLRAWYYGATRDLSSIYFGTHATLVPRDRDGGELDIYVARIGGGFPELETGECEGACGTTSEPTNHRSAPASAGGAPRLVLAPLDRAARRQLVADGWTTLLAEVPAAGRVTAEGRARIGSRRSLVASGSAEAKEAGPVRLRLVLMPVAQRRLAQGRELRVGLVLRRADADEQRRTGFVLWGSRE